ncbi:chemotaxis protein CheW, partial [Rhodoplanes sp. SY1]|uniref:chemotaxis protein CheW n=1 Tax=Rhodoplanes sp. SY1 TaxID=3166646 RepID=UPI0038B4B1CF
MTFHVDHETFAVPLIEVQEIIRLPQMVEVPLAPASLAGLANLRGSVLPVTSLRRLFGLADVKHDDSTRVVVINRGRQVGFVVDRMASVVTSETSEIEGVEGLRSTIDTGLLSGMIKRQSGMVMILDPGKLTQMGDGEGRRRQDKSDLRSEQLQDEAAGRTEEDETSDEMQLVSFELDGQEYALPIEHVQEIVQVPETINVIPNSESHVLGVMNLRNRLLPLVSLRSLFGLGATEVGDQSRILVIAFEMGKTVLSVGIVTDAVKEVLRVARGIVDPLPELLSHDGALREVESVCRIDGGKRLVSILSVERLFSNATIREALDAGSARADETAMSETDDAKHGKADEEEQFV